MAHWERLELRVAQCPRAGLGSFGNFALRGQLCAKVYAALLNKITT